MRLTTLCYIENNRRWLMLLRNKKEGDINRGKWIGVGGKFEANESPDECLFREVYEETGLTLATHRYRGIVTFCYDDHDAEYMHLYTASTEMSHLPECSEGELAWIAPEAIDDLPLWPGDRIFLPLLLKETPAFSLKLVYEQEVLKAAILDGVPLSLTP